MKKRFERIILVITVCIAVLVSAVPTAYAEPDGSETLDELISDFMKQYRLSEKNFSFAYFNTVTGEEYSFNEDKLMLSASIYKLPLNMYYYEQEAQGLISSSAKFYGYPLSECHKLSLQYSHNETSQAMQRALGTYKQYKTCLDRYTGANTEEMEALYQNSNYFSARHILNTLKYLYENSVFFSEAIGYLKAAQPGQFFKKYVNKYEIAQKYGWLTSVANTAGIVYTPHSVSAQRVHRQRE